MESSQMARWDREIEAMGRAGAWDCESLRQLVVLQQVMDGAVHKAARDLNTQGFSWAEIGAALGITRTAAHKRYAATG